MQALVVFTNIVVVRSFHSLTHTIECNNARTQRTELRVHPKRVCFVLYSKCIEKNMWFSESLSFTMQNYQRQCLKCWKQLQRIKFLFSVTAKQQCNCNIHNAKTYSAKLFYGKFICLQFVLFGCVVQFAFKCIHMWASSLFPNICMDVQCFFLHLFEMRLLCCCLLGISLRKKNNRFTEYFAYKYMHFCNKILKTKASFTL